MGHVLHIIHETVIPNHSFMKIIMSGGMSFVPHKVSKGIGLSNFKVIYEIWKIPGSWCIWKVAKMYRSWHANIVMTFLIQLIWINVVSHKCDVDSLFWSYLCNWLIKIVSPILVGRRYTSKNEQLVRKACLLLWTFLANSIFLPYVINREFRLKHHQQICFQLLKPK